MSIYFCMCFIDLQFCMCGIGCSLRYVNVYIACSIVFFIFLPMSYSFAIRKHVTHQNEYITYNAHSPCVLITKTEPVFCFLNVNCELKSFDLFMVKTSSTDSEYIISSLSGG